MASVRVTVSFADGVPPQERPALLAALAGDLRESLADGDTLTRSASLSLPGGGTEDAIQTGPPLDRIFNLAIPDGASASPFLRALGGWLMRHGGTSVSVRAEGPRGGVSLRLADFSAVAFAAAAARIMEQLSSDGQG